MSEERFMIQLANIRFAVDADGNLLNPRGAIRDTSDLQPTLERDGQKEPIEVYAEGAYWFPIDGHRRVTAAKALGWVDIWARPVPRPKSLGDWMLQVLARNNRKPYSPLELARIFATLVADKKIGVERAALTHGISVDEVKLYIELLSAPAEVQARMEKGEMSLQAFREVRHKPVELQKVVASLPKPTVAATRNVVRKARAEKEADAPRGSFTAESLKAVAEPELIRLLRSTRAAVRGAIEFMTPEQKDIARFLAADIVELLNPPRYDDFTEDEAAIIAERMTTAVGEDALLDEDDLEA